MRRLSTGHCEAKVVEGRMVPYASTRHGRRNVSTGDRVASVGDGMLVPALHSGCVVWCARTGRGVGHA
eukprot:3172735-Rhodomonas_salina.2